MNVTAIQAACQRKAQRTEARGTSVGPVCDGGRAAEPMRWTIHDERIVDDTRFWLAARTTGGLVDINEVERIAWIPLDEVLNYVACGEIVGAASLVGLLDVLARRQRRPVANLASTGECHVCASGEPAADGFLA